eukprot:gi/632941085/ref/XP_007885675.1/ PREDICTED: cytosolic 5'-nucleotidase 1A-like [Callorhinchus milii]
MEAGDQIIVNTEVTQKDSAQAVTIAVSSRAIFDLEEEHELFLAEGMGNYTSHQIAHENEPLAEGTALPFIRAVQMVNEKLLENNPEEKQLFDIILVSNNNAQSGLRIINSIKHYGLHITRFCFLNGIDPSKYLQSYNVKLFLSANESAVCSALKRGIPAALVIQQDVQTAAEQLRVVFDGDCVLFSDESENVYREKGLDEVIKYEKDREHIPIGEGPLKAFAMILGNMKKKFPREKDPICTYLLTSRSGRDMGVRAIKTLRDWGLEVDQAFFLDGAPKDPILAQIRPHIFFDDSTHHIRGALASGTPAGYIPPCDKS